MAAHPMEDSTWTTPNERLRLLQRIDWLEERQMQLAMENAELRAMLDEENYTEMEFIVE